MKLLQSVLRWEPQVVLALDSAQQKTGERLSESLILAVIHAESSGDPKAVSTCGARGLMQLMPATAKSLGCNANIPEQNIKAGTLYLTKLYKQFGSITLAIAAYNAGPGNVRKYHGIPPFTETQHYVKKVLALEEIYG